MLNSIVFVHSWVLILIPLPLIALFLPAYPSQRSALNVSFMEQLTTASGMGAQPVQAVAKASLLQKFLALMVWLCVIVALMRPQLIEAPVVIEHSQRDLLLSVDLSGSMETRDFTLEDGQQVDRLEAVKNILNPFFDARSGERMGLIFFGSAAFVQAPFTTDLQALQNLLEEAQVAMAGPKTVIGDSIAMAVKMFEERQLKENNEVDDRLLILLTDGNDTGSRVPPEEASELAKKSEVKIITIAVGDPINAGEHSIDTQSLESIAKKTGGQFYYAMDSQELKNVLQEINRLTPKEVERETYNPTSELYQWPLLTSVVLILLYALLLFKQNKRGEA